MPAGPELTSAQAVARRCPVCGSGEGPAIEANVDATRLDELAFASRKLPEYMHWRLVACPVCDTLYANPAPPEAVLEAAYAQAGYDSPEAAAYAARTYSRLLPAVLDRTPGEGGALDVGTGDGAFLRELRAAGVDDVAGIEPSPAARAAARDDIRPLIVSGRFDPGDFEPGRFRLVTCFQTLEHVEDPLGLCRGAHRVLRSGGAVVVVCHDRRAPLNRLLGRRSPIYDVQHLQLFSRASLRALLERAGFERVEVRPLVNRYPLRAWARYLPLPAGGKRRLLAALNGRAGAVAVPIRAGNLVGVGYRPRSARNT